MSSIIDGVDYGPLAVLIGTWSGALGMDISPEPDGDDHNPYFETLVFEPAGDVDNAEVQELVSVRYHQVVTRKRDDKIFHNETGYLVWQADTRLLMQTLSIARGLSLVAGGSVNETEHGVTFEVAAATDSQDWPIAQSPFLTEHAFTKSFTHQITVQGDQLSYSETMLVSIYGEEHTHIDTNQLTR